MMLVLHNNQRGSCGTRVAQLATKGAACAIAQAMHITCDYFAQFKPRGDTRWHVRKCEFTVARGCSSGPHTDPNAAGLARRSSRLARPRLQ